MATEKRKINRVIDAAGNTIQVLPETSAEQVTLADAGNKFTSTNVEGALTEVGEDIAELKTGLASAGKVDDVQDVNGASIVTNKIAKLSKAAVGLGNVDNTADANKSVKYADEAGKVTNKLSISAHNGTASNKTVTFDGSVGSAVDFDVNSFEYSSTDNGMKISLVDKGYATKTYVDTQDNKKLDKAGGTVTGALAVNGGLTVGGNLTVNGTTTSIDSTTLKVSDKLIEVAKDNTVQLTTPAGIVVPNYDGRKYGALVIDGNGNAQVGDVNLDASGNIDVANSDLQTLATRTGLVNDYLVKYDSANQTLVDSGKKITDFATAAQGSNADSALAKANANATEIANIKNGTNGTKVKYAEHADTADSATSAGSATNATNATSVTTNIGDKKITDIFESDGTTVKAATNVTTRINGKAISYIFESDGTTVKKATEAKKVAKQLLIGSSDGTHISLYYDGQQEERLGFLEGELEAFRLAGMDYTQVRLAYTGVAEGQYSAVNVDRKGRVTAGGKSIEWGTSGQTTPSNDLMIGGLFMELQE